MLSVTKIIDAAESLEVKHVLGEAKNKDSEFRMEHKLDDQFNSKFTLSDTVGINQTNKISDLKRTYHRLVELGFIRIRIYKVKQLFHFIKMFEAAINGHPWKYSSLKGIINPYNGGNNLYKWLQAINAPKWEILDPGSIENGYLYNPSNLSGGDFYCTSWMQKMITDVGKTYIDSVGGHLGKNVAINIHELSNVVGYQHGGHGSHYSGMDIDVRLPKKIPENSYYNARNVGSNYKWSDYDREATNLMLGIFNEHPFVSLIIFNDPELHSIGYQKLIKDKEGNLHDNHLHVRIKPANLGPVISDNPILNTVSTW